MTLRNSLWVGLAATLGLVGQANAQSPSPQAPYGFPTMQSAQTGGVSYTCQPTTDTCQLPKVGCYVVTDCPCPCQPKDLCQEINSKLPPIKPVPNCHEVPVCVIYSDKAPDKTVTIPVVRNCYVPIKVKVVPVPHNDVTAVNFQVKWREVHIICDEKGTPLAPDKAAAILKEMQAEGGSQLASGAPGEAKPSTVDAAPVAPMMPAAPATSSAKPAAPADAVKETKATATGAPAQQPAATTAAPSATEAAKVSDASSPQKQWVWLAYEGMYGYGYQRADGYWEIDPDSRRKSL